MAAVRQASINPARALGLPSTGLVAGAAADLVVLVSDLAVTGVCVKDRGPANPMLFRGADDGPTSACQYVVRLVGQADCFGRERGQGRRRNR